jgi:hypothetical protein
MNTCRDLSLDVKEIALRLGFLFLTMIVVFVLCRPPHYPRHAGWAYGRYRFVVHRF